MQTVTSHGSPKKFGTTQRDSATGSFLDMRTISAARTTSLRPRQTATVKSTLLEQRAQDPLGVYLHQQIRKSRAPRPLDGSLGASLPARGASTAIPKKKRGGISIPTTKTEATPIHKKCRSRLEENLLGPETRFRRAGGRPYAGSQFV